MTDAASRTYAVQGMTCHHCTIAVREEVGEVDGVEAVSVDLDTGRLEVRGSGIDDQAIRAAVEEAGYRVAPDG